MIRGRSEAFADRREVVEEAALSGLVVVGPHLKRGVRPELGGQTSQCRLASLVRVRAGGRDHRDPAAGSA